ncbi:MAG: hypothetical protein JXJ17_15425 [Anaerolineae bacterium]|nr:hypothetical protein [Anaerolineae bacterium]
MSWLDICINRDVTKDDIRNALSQVVGIDRGRIKAIDSDYADWWDRTPEIDITVILETVRGDYFTVIRLIVFDLDLVKCRDVHEFIGRVCEVLDCSALTTHGEGTSHPYSWILIRGVDDYYHVFVDSDMLDDEQGMGLRIDRIVGRWV